MLEDDINAHEMSIDYWLNEKITKKNIIQFIKFMGEEFPDHYELFNDLRKKIIRGNRAVLSIMITFSREIDKDNQNLVNLSKKLIQTFMDNPRGFKK